MKEYRIAVSCDAYGIVRVIADSLEDAIQHVRDVPTMGNLGDVGFEYSSWDVDVDLCRCFAFEDCVNGDSAGEFVGYVVDVTDRESEPVIADDENERSV